MPMAMKFLQTLTQTADEAKTEKTNPRRSGLDSEKTKTFERVVKDFTWVVSTAEAMGRDYNNRIERDPQVRRQC